MSRIHLFGKMLQSILENFIHNYFAPFTNLKKDKIELQYMY